VSQNRVLQRRKAKAVKCEKVRAQSDRVTRERQGAPFHKQERKESVFVPAAVTQGRTQKAEKKAGKSLKRDAVEPRRPGS